MKKILFILMMVIITSLSFADNDMKINSTTNTSTMTLEELKPSLPTEATFEEDVIDTLLLKVLSPMIPKEANFEE